MNASSNTPEQQNESSTISTPRLGLTDEQREKLKEVVSRGNKQGPEENIRALWRFARLEGLTEIAAFDADRWKPQNEKYSKYRGHCVAYGELNDVVVLHKQASAEMHASGFYVVPALLTDGGRHRYDHFQWIGLGKGQTTAGEADISDARVLVIDVDVSPPKGRRAANTTKQQWSVALHRAWRIRQWLVDLGCPEPALAFASSGNGAHLLVAHDSPWSSELKSLRERLIRAAGLVWDTEVDGMEYAVDLKMADGARYIPLYGSMKRKAAHHADHPQRQTWVVAPDESKSLTFDEFVRLVEAAEADVRPEEQPKEPQKNSGATVASTKSGSKPVSGAWQSYWAAIDAVPIEQVVEHFGIETERCPSCQGEMKGKPFVKNLYHCHHDSCSAHKKGNYSGVDLVQAHLGLGWDWQDKEARKAAGSKIAEAFSIAAPARRSRRSSADGRPRDEWENELLMTEVGRGEEKTLVVRNVRENVELCLRKDPKLQGLVKYDEFKNDIVFARTPPWTGDYVGSAGDSKEGSSWKDVDDLRLAGYLSKSQGMIHLDPKTVVQGLQVVAADDRIHPLRDYLNGLSWDGVSRVDRWLSTYAGANTEYGFEDEPMKGAEYVSLVGKWWLLQAVARVFEPGVKCDSTLVLEGPQGAMKSTILSVLAGEAYFSDGDLGDLKNKESAMQLQGVWVQELGEGEIFSRASRRALKAFLTKRHDDYIPKHSNRKTRVARHTVFCVTTNDREYLDDSSGERRWWPVWVEQIELEKLKADRDQLWAEAAHLYAAGEKWWARTDAEKALCEAATGERKLSHPWADQIRLRLKNDVREGDSISVNEVLTNVLGLSLASLKNSFEAQKVREILREQGWVPEKRNKHGQRWARGPSALPFEGPVGDPVDQLGDGELDEFFESSKSVAEIERLRDQNRKLTARLDRAQEGAGKTYDKYIVALRELHSLGVPLPVDDHETVLN